MNKQIQNMNIEDLKIYCDAQYSTILDLNKKVKKLQDENEHLKKLLDSTVPDLTQQKNIIVPQLDSFSEQVIAEVQLQRLKQLSDDRELTLEETRKVAEYSKILSFIRINKKKDIEVEAKEADTKELLQLVKGENNGQTPK